MRWELAPPAADDDRVTSSRISSERQLLLLRQLAECYNKSLWGISLDLQQLCLVSFAIISLDIALVFHVPAAVLVRVSDPVPVPVPVPVSDPVPAHLCQRAHKAAGWR